MIFINMFSLRFYTIINLSLLVYLLGNSIQAYSQEGNTNLQLQPLDQVIFNQTEDFLKNYKKSERSFKIIVEEIEFNKGSDIKIAEKGNVFSLLQRTGSNSATLKYYDLNGKLFWEKQINILQAEPNKILQQVSNTGKRILISYTEYGSEIVVGLRDEEGNQLYNDGNLVNLRMTPSGNFFYPIGEGIYTHGDFRIYDTDLNLITENDLDFIDISDENDFRYIYKYRITKFDKLFLIVSKLKKNDKSVLSSKNLYIYNLINKNLDYATNLIGKNGEIIDLNIDNSSLAIQNNKVVMGGFLENQVSFLEIDLRQKKESLHNQFNRYQQIELSKEGDNLYLFQSNNIVVYNLSRQNVENKIKIKNRISQIDELEINGDTLKIKSKYYPENINKLTFYSLNNGNIIIETFGWFYKNLKTGIMPVRSMNNKSNINLIKIEKIN